MIASKREMYLLYEAGKFGNKPKTFDNLEAYYASCFPRPVTLRYSGSGGGAWCEYEVTLERVPAVLKKWQSEGANLALVKLNEGLPDPKLMLQGEVQRSQNVIDLRYSTAKLPMRKALATDQKHTHGIEAISLLRWAMCASSYEDLQVLLDTYPDSVVEFGCYSCDVGGIPNRNTLFWEVRNY